MNGIKQHLDNAFKLISSIPVSQDNVEIMATAKAHLRAVYAELNKQDGAENGG